MSLLSVVEAAAVLGVSRSRVQERIANGSLPAEKVGGQWVIKSSALASVRGAVHARPLSNKMAWAVLAVLADREPKVIPQEKYRACKYASSLLAADDPAPLMRAWFKNRAQRRIFRAAEADLADMANDERIHLSGVSDPDAGVIAQGVVEGYVDSNAFEDLVSDYFLVAADPGEGNVILHQSQEEVLDGLHVWSVVAADLAEHSGPRENARVRELLVQRKARP